MAKPPWVWTNGWDFPKLYTWEYKAKMELFDLFDYNPDLEELNNLKEPNFETFSLPSMCKGADNVLLKRYCKVTKHIPDLHTTMLLMQLAKFPLTFKEDLKKKFRFDLIVRIVFIIVALDKKNHSIVDKKNHSMFYKF